MTKWGISPKDFYSLSTEQFWKIYYYNDMNDGKKVTRREVDLFERERKRNKRRKQKQKQRTF